MIRPAIALVVAAAWASGASAAESVFLAGAARVDVSPTTFPVLVNGGFLEARASSVRDPLFASALVLDDGKTRLAIVVVDSCMMPRDLLDRAKAIAQEKAGIAADKVLISATHTHTAPAAMGALGCDADPAYVQLLPGKIAEAVADAVTKLQPAQVGWGSVDDHDHTFCRRWIRKPDKLVVDPFSQPTGRAHMHPGHANPDALGPSGPVDPELSVLSVRTPKGRPLAVLANYSMHYFGTEPVSADYFSRFSRELARLIGADGSTPFVAMMSQGTSGDQQWANYAAPASKQTIDGYAEAVARSALRALGRVVYHDWAPLGMAETTLTLQRRIPDEARLAWARPILAAMGSRSPKTLPEVYAREAIALHDDPTRVLKLQALRIGDLGIAAIPNEVYALTGLKIKARSPLRSTFTIELANGSEGYIPPPEQHALGGYTTWPARTAALEVQAEPKIVEAVLGLLEKVSGSTRRQAFPAETTYSEAVAASKPRAFWRLDEMDGAVTADSTGHSLTGALEDGFALFLEGVPSARTSVAGADNRAIHLAGGRLTSKGFDAAGPFTVELWFKNGLPADARKVCGTLIDVGNGRLRVEIGGKGSHQGRLVLRGSAGESDQSAAGSTEVVPQSWYHLALTRDGRSVRLLLNGREETAFERPDAAGPSGRTTLAIGGSEDRSSRFEGKVDEVAVYDRALKEGEAAAHVNALGVGR